MRELIEGSVNDFTETIFLLY